MNKTRSALAHFCLTLRTARALTQADLAVQAGVHISTLKNIEGDRAVSLGTLRTIYRAGLRTKDPISPEEWHKLIGYWLLRELEGDVSLQTVAAGISGAEAHIATVEAKRTKRVLAAMQKLDAQSAETVADVATALAGRKGAAVRDAVQSVLALAA